MFGELQVPEYTVYQLLSDIGGQLGLWIGMSIITLTEILNLVFNLIQVCISKRRLAGEAAATASVNKQPRAEYSLVAIAQ